MAQLRQAELPRREVYSLAPMSRSNGMVLVARGLLSMHGIMIQVARLRLAGRSARADSELFKLDSDSDTGTCLQRSDEDDARVL